MTAMITRRAKKAIGLDWQNNNFARASHFFVHCYVVARLQRETSSFHRFFCRCFLLSPFLPGGGGVLPYMGYIGMCCCEGYGFQAVYSRKGI